MINPRETDPDTRRCKPNPRENDPGVRVNASVAKALSRG